jgi:hypothetical protein
LGVSPPTAYSGIPGFAAGLSFGAIGEIPAIIRRMTRTHAWITTTGGPHLLIAGFLSECVMS